MKNLLPSLALGALLLAPDGVIAAAFDSQIQRCPQSCSISGAQVSDWTSYHSLDRLDICLSPVLFSFNIHNDLDNHQVIKACTAGDASSNGTVSSTCSSMTSFSENLRLAWDSKDPDSASSSAISQVLLALQSQVENDPSCGNSTILFAHYEGFVAALYIGAAFDSLTATRNLISQVSSNQESIAGGTFSAQVCGSTRDASRTNGLMISEQNEYRTVQSAVQSWSNATCVEEFTNTDVVSDVKFRQSPRQNITTINGKRVQKRADACSYTTVVSGDGCASLASRCGITAAQLSTYNPSSTLCSSLAVGEIICCSEGSVPDLSPQPSSDGTCYSYTVKSGDDCPDLATTWHTTQDKIESYNKDTWGWMGCANLQAESTICLSSGEPPMPGGLDLRIQIRTGRSRALSDAKTFRYKQSSSPKSELNP
ncbi:uncharacterized protein N7518_010162 [Penicillium psychrosexuale]|uniref:uncharacterized protein n=1 Tax=Penicillium psychrosexuale TaxID=1002107 RepID=UPI002545A11C|nr:uncharacterized protein N7518_010162 [Penicillium psychrosexuale]KAJ5781679.1 hypothetical protein N7518_010162 [Penicillium psychrosexuale]